MDGTLIPVSCHAATVPWGTHYAAQYTYHDYFCHSYSLLLLLLFLLLFLLLAISWMPEEPGDDEE